MKIQITTKKMSNTKKKPKFIRRDWYKKSKLGLHRKKKQVWRRPKGRHNKMRQRWKGHDKRPSRGYGAAKTDRGKISGLIPRMIFNLNNLMKMNREKEIGIIGKGVGGLNKEQIAKKAIESKIRFTNFNPESFLKKINEMREKNKTEKLIAKNKKEQKQEAKAEEKKIEANSENKMMKDKKPTVDAGNHRNLQEVSK